MALCPPSLSFVTGVRGAHAERDHHSSPNELVASP